MAVLFQNGALVQCTYGYKNTKPKGITRMIIETERLNRKNSAQNEARLAFKITPLRGGAA